MNGPGEFELIARLLRRLGPSAPEPPRGPGDDAAVSIHEGTTVTSVDMAVEGVHFDLGTSPPALVGRKALAAALSDLAAMGATPAEAYVALGIPVGFEANSCEELYEGLASLAAETGTSVGGGDISRAPALTLAITVVGRCADGPVARAGARPGDVVALTGELGGAGAGLLLLEGAGGGDIGEEPATALIARQREPTPRLAEGAALAAAGATAMIDLSDGLGSDASHLATAGGVRLRIELEALPIQPGVAEVAAAAGRDPIELAAGAGEDYELLACLPPDRLASAQQVLAALGTPLSVIGRVEPGEGLELVDVSGIRRDVAGFDQLAG